jgi:alkanesulfonate monooxygenase SsuD/methylene tetrahydromethanopterin reductase-like flavin-dependent oxidoreductase (luciferase family)
MEFFVTYSNGDSDGPVEWGRRRDAEGWTGVAVADHICAGGQGWWHPFATLGAIAAATQRVHLTHAFANNLMSLHAISGGRFEVGIGAGWVEAEIRSAGLEFPNPRERAERLRDAVLIIKDLLRGECCHQGAHYDVKLKTAGPSTKDPPLLAASLGGPWTLKNIAPLLDRVEVNPIGVVIRGGDMDWPKVGTVTDDDVKTLVALAREANPDAQVGLSVFLAVGDGSAVRSTAKLFGDGYMKGLAGPPAQVADALWGLQRFAADRVTFVPLSPNTSDLLAPELFK